MQASDLSSEEFNSYYKNYINQAGNLNLIDGLEFSYNKTSSFLNEIPSNKWAYAYESSKWTINELVQHLIDSERVFAYRAMRFARKDFTSLPGYDENEYAPASLANERTKESLIEEYTTVRRATISLFNSFTNDMLMQIGEASNSNMSVRAIGFVIIGHETHHSKIIAERYL